MHADVLVLPESYDARKGIDHDAELALSNLGYDQIVEVPYGDEVELKDSYSDPQALMMMVASRIVIIESEIIRLGDLRNMLRVQVEDPASGGSLDIYSLHFDHRGKVFRMRQVEDLARIMKKRAQQAEPIPSVAIGDYNSMTGERLTAQILRSSMAMAAGMNLPQMYRRVAEQAIDMASGDELRQFQELTGMQNIDPTGAPTTTPKLRGMPFWVPAIRMLDIDHIYHSPEVSVDDFKIMNRDGGSDHRAISATLSVASPR